MAKKKNGDVVVKKLTDDVDVTAEKQGVTDVGMEVMDIFAKSGKFHSMATKIVKASAQAKILDALSESLSESRKQFG